MFSCFGLYDITLAICMWIFLAMGAWFDAHGAEVPDALTIPYTILGAAAAIAHKRFAAALFIAVVTVGILQPYRPKWMQRLNMALLRHAYKGDEEALAKEAEKACEEARGFQSKHEKTADTIVTGLYVLIPAVGMAAALWDKWETGSSTTIPAARMVIIGLLACAYILTHTKDTGEDLPPSALGEADILLFLGLFGFYESMPFLLGMCATLSGYLVWIAVKMLITRTKIVGTALFPAFFAFAPIRFLIAATWMAHTPYMAEFFLF